MWRAMIAYVMKGNNIKMCRSLCHVNLRVLMLPCNTILSVERSFHLLINWSRHQAFLVSRVAIHVVGSKTRPVKEWWVNLLVEANGHLAQWGRLVPIAMYIASDDTASLPSLESTTRAEAHPD